MIDVQKLTFSYGKKVICKDLYFHTKSSYLNCIIGRNGVGKSTILDLIAGLATPLSGEISPNIKSSNIIYQMQGVPMLMDVTGQNILDMFQDLNFKKQRHNSFLDDIYNEIIMHLVDEKYRDMSGGERRLIIIYAMCCLERSLYLFDEPTSGLDPVSSNRILDLLSNLAKESDVIITTHDLSELRRIKCNVIFIANKKCIFQGDYGQLMEEYAEKDPVEAFVDALNQDKVKNFNF